MGKTVLIVDDEPKICNILSQFFAARGFQPVTATSGVEALDRLGGIRPDFLMVDVRMPDMSGLDVLKLAKERIPGLKVVVITGMPDIETAQEAFRLGAFDVIAKPMKMDDRDWERAFFSPNAGDTH